MLSEASRFDNRHTSPMPPRSNANEVLRHGAYICLTPTADEQQVLTAAPVASITRRLSLENEFRTQAGHPRHAVAFCAESTSFLVSSRTMR